MACEREAEVRRFSEYGSMAKEIEALDCAAAIDALSAEEIAKKGMR